MATYVKPIDGFIVDNPQLDFIRCDGRKFSFKNVKTANFTNTSNVLEITGGWSQYPLAYIDTTKVLELAFTSAEFSLDMFEMANAVALQAATEPILKSALLEVGAGLVVTVPEKYATTPELNVFVNGFTMVASPATAESGDITVASATDNTTLTFYAGDVAVGDTILVSYMHTPVNGQALYVPTSSGSARGELFVHYPVYSSGKDCTDASIKGYLTLNLYRVRVTELPGLDSSYKSETNPGMKFSAIEPGRADGRMFALVYEAVA